MIIPDKIQTLESGIEVYYFDSETMPSTNGKGYFDGRDDRDLNLWRAVSTNSIKVARISMRQFFSTFRYLDGSRHWIINIVPPYDKVAFLVSEEKTNRNMQAKKHFLIS